ncbi:kinesin-domain-containing protein [Calocera viscosa TUFC12733]|uniref:Kinesin-like protein n=1 Tax=Calocera viscosa (strain TUFC12733) TaxID=1330018 RepID=A0A167FPK5_CALVF|nr:kinesin-domain-containing protein [Calocera viscosa TUFC12733]
MGSTKVIVAVRCRPFLPNEEQDDVVKVSAPAEDGADGFVSVLNSKNTREEFRFKSCWDQSSTQEEIFERDVRPILEQAFSGYTACLFCYGVTSSGKTHTMQGSVSDPGIIRRALRYFLAAGCGEGRSDVHVTISYVEIYKDEVYDLLHHLGKPLLSVRGVGEQIFIPSLTEIPITSPQEFEKRFASACKLRSTSATRLNGASSRSHAILTTRVWLTRTDGTVTEGKINLIDLAGSENNKLTGNDSSRMAESSAINRSLSILGQVVDALNHNLPHVPYRSSKLTRILQPSLGGKSIGLLICCIAPGAKYKEDTLRTLGFGSRTKTVENHPLPAAPTMAPEIPEPPFRESCSLSHPPTKVTPLR